MFRVSYVGKVSESAQKDVRNFENFQRSQSFRTLENILHTFFANSLQIVWILENFFVSLYNEKGERVAPIERPKAKRKGYDTELLP